MGNDGGSIPKRRELVKSGPRAPTASELKETLREHLAFAWSTCPLSHTALTPPIVSDAAGNLYNKDSVLQVLLPEGAGSSGEQVIINREDAERVLGGRVKALKDVVEVKFTVEDSKWVCPITSKVLGPAVKSVYLVPCGHAFSEEAVREVKVEGERRCLQCNEAYKTDDVITVLPTGDVEKERLKARMERMKEEGLAHSLKRASGSGKKRKKGVIKDEDPAGPTEATATKPDPLENTSLPTPPPIDPVVPHRSSTSTHPQPKPTNGIKNAATASLTARVLAEEAERTKRRKLAGQTDSLRGLFSNKESRERGKDGDFMTRGFSIPAGAKR